jgi:hypothetical protein
MPPRVRSAFQADALFELIVGSILMANPLLGPRIGINGFVVALIGVLCLFAAIVLGGAALGKGPLHNRLPLMAAINAVSAVAIALWAVLRDIHAPGRVFLAAIALGLMSLASVQMRAARDPSGGAPVRTPPTREELQAALRGESR